MPKTLNQAAHNQVWVISFSSCSVGPHRPNKTGHCNCSCYFSVLNCKYPLRKITQSWVIGHGEIKLVVTWMLCSHWPAFIMLEWAMYSTPGEKCNDQSYLDTILHGTVKASLAGGADYFNSGGTIMRITNCFLVGFMAALQQKPIPGPELIGK